MQTQLIKLGGISVECDTWVAFIKEQISDLCLQLTAISHRDVIVSMSMSQKRADYNMSNMKTSCSECTAGERI